MTITQADLVASWFDRHQKNLIIGFIVFLVLVIGIGVGFYYFNNASEHSAESASMIYDDLLKANKTGETDKIQKIRQSLIVDYPKTPYACFALMMNAKDAVDQGRYQRALNYLRQAQNTKGDHLAEIKKIARIRAVRILLLQGKAKMALNMLTPIEDKRDPVINELKGDIELALGNRQGAQTAYRSADQGMQMSNQKDFNLKMKLENVS